MQDKRSASQILFGFLPEQTVDLRGGIWRVKSWEEATRRSIDDQTLRRGLIKQAGRWGVVNKDGGYVTHLHEGRDIEVRSLNMETGVRVDRFPNVWLCRRCKRGYNKKPATCKCGANSWNQLPFVHYHSCGAIKAPFLPKCQQHHQTKVVMPATMLAREIRIICPVCDKTLREGLGQPKCECGDGTMTYMHHRSGLVYTPRSITVVNPPSREQTTELHQAGGGSRALAWVVDGMDTRSFKDRPPTRRSLIETLLAQGLSLPMAESFADNAVSSGEIEGDEEAGVDIPADKRAEAEAEATDIALATFESRRTTDDLVAMTDVDTGLGELYGTEYPIALARAGLHSIELVDSFPVLTGTFAYTRGDSSPGNSRLVPYRSPKGTYIVYGDISNTEALFIQLKPTAVARWLEMRGFKLPDCSDDRSARIAILSVCDIPAPGEEPEDGPGSALLTLVHSFSHRFIRRVSSFAGIERTAISELLLPLHLGMFVYAAARGDFVLGGLQAVFETELANALTDFAEGEHRCAMDPGCRRHGAACAACLHLGEPSCHHYNTFLDRRALWGPKGYLGLIKEPSISVPAS